MLAADGHRILHSTRHSSIELGKDIISIAPDGTPCAYQLKGNPGSRLSLREFREIEPQCRELVNLSIKDQGVPAKPHRSFLVTNGLIEEEVRLAIERLNDANLRDGYPNRRLEYLQRGDLLDMANRLGHALWPTEIPQLSHLLEMLVEDGGGLFPTERAHLMLREMLGLVEENPPPSWSAAEIQRRITSAALLISVSLRNFEARDNHFAVISAWVQFAAYSVACCERLEADFASQAASAVEISLTRVRDALIDLAAEAVSRENLLEGDVLVDSAFYLARYTLVLGLLSVFWLWCDPVGWPSGLDREKLKAFLDNGVNRVYLWGEAALPQVLAYYWFLRNTNPLSFYVDGLLAGMVDACVAVGPDGNTLGIPSPYWGIEAVSRHVLAPILGTDQDPMRNETIGRMSFFAESLIHLLVRAGRKRACSVVWPDATKTVFARFQPETRWQYCLWRTTAGSQSEVQPPLTKQWSELVEEARSIRCDSAPAQLIERPHLHALFLILFPYRATPDVVRSLSYFFDRTWFILDPPKP
jgi:hypothetical protein